MANTVTALIPSIIAGVVRKLRSSTRMPALVNGDYNAGEAQQVGNVINVPLPPTISTAAVSPSVTPTAVTNLTPTVAQIPIDQWRRSDAIHITDKERRDIVERNMIPPGIEAAVEALMAEANQFIMGKYKGVYGYYGPDLTKVPFATISAAGDELNWAMQPVTILNNQKCPSGMRRGVISTAAHANAAMLAPFRDISQSGDDGPINTAAIGTKFGVDWYWDHDVPVHTAGTAAAATVTLISNSDVADTSVTLKVASGTATVVEGDILTITGDTQTYVVTAGATLTTSGVSVSIDPPLKIAVDGSSSPVNSTIKASHKVHMLFHKDAFAFVNRPLDDEDSENSTVQTIVDPITGMTLRLETARQNKLRTWELDILYGAALVRPELACRIAGLTTG